MCDTLGMTYSKTVYALLQKSYNIAAAKAEAADGLGNWEYLDAVCDEAWNDLIDFVESNDLNGTPLDPRIPARSSTADRFHAAAQMYNHE